MSFHSYCGGLFSPGYAANPLGYKFSSSSRGVLLALLNTGRFLEDGKAVDVPREELMGYAKGYYGGPVAYDFVGHPTRDSKFLPFPLLRILRW